MDEPILMKLYKIVVYNLKMCMKERYARLNRFKGNNSREVII